MPLFYDDFNNDVLQLIMFGDVVLFWFKTNTQY